MKCKNCGREYNTFNEHYPKDYCSYNCYEIWTRWHKEPNCECCICHKKMYMKPYRIKRIKNGITCSDVCKNKLKEQYMLGEQNHQYNLIGDKNASFKNKDLISNTGYILEYCPGHPYPHDNNIKGSRVLQHRLVIERNYKLFPAEYFEEINGWVVLKQEYDVHHKNEIRTDNRLENLAVLKRGEHTKLHNMTRKIIRDDLGRIIGVVKSGNNGEVCDDNPVINSEIAKGSESSYSVESE